MSGAVFLRLESVGKRFGEHTVLASISLDVEQGEFLTLLGESGSGKTTLLRILAGFEEATAWIPARRPGPRCQRAADRRPIHTALQSYALLPHMSVFLDNVAYGLRVRPRPRRDDFAGKRGAGKGAHGSASPNTFLGRSAGDKSSVWRWPWALVNLPRSPPPTTGSPRSTPTYAWKCSAS